MLYSLRRTTPISRGIREKLNGSTFVVDVKNVHGGVATGTHGYDISLAGRRTLSFLLILGYPKSGEDPKKYLIR